MLYTLYIVLNLCHGILVRSTCWDSALVTYMLTSHQTCIYAGYGKQLCIYPASGKWLTQLYLLLKNDNFTSGKRFTCTKPIVMMTLPSYLDDRVVHNSNSLPMRDSQSEDGGLPAILVGR